MRLMRPIWCDSRQESAPKRAEISRMIFWQNLTMFLGVVGAALVWDLPYLMLQGSTCTGSCSHSPSAQILVQDQ